MTCQENMKKTKKESLQQNNETLEVKHADNTVKKHIKVEKR